MPNPYQSPLSRHTALIALIALASPAQAQEVAPQSAGAPEEKAGDIVVTAPRIKGSVETDVPPDLVLDSAAIESYGASSLTDLISLLSTQTRTGRGRDGGGAVILLNGRRISSFAEVRDIPPEAIERFETFPEEVALKYGFAADQKVVNLILKPDFQSKTAELEQGGPTSAVRSSTDAQFSWLRIGKKGRTNISGQYTRDSQVLESERGIVQPALGLENFRTLLPASDQLRLNAVTSRNIADAVGATINLSFNQADAASLFGLSTPGPDGSQTPLHRDLTSRAANAGLTLNGNVGRLFWTGTASFAIESGRTLTDQPAGPSAPRNIARSRSRTAAANWTVTGQVAELAAGPVTASLNAGFQRRRFNSRSDRAGVFQQAALGRSEANTNASVDIPLASRGRGVADALGDLSVNLNASYRHLSDFGGLASFGYGLNWSPSQSLHFGASVAAAKAAPSQEQLRNPPVSTPNVSVYDYVRGETALVTLIGGGNPLLRTEERRDVKLSLSYDAPKLPGLTVKADYYRNRASNPLSVFPELTPDIERAFPGRVVRAADGRLVSIDQRAINYLSSANDEFRWSIDFSKQIGPPPQGRPGADGAGRPRNAAGSGGRGGIRFGEPAKRVQVSLAHTVKLKDEIRIARALPVLDLLNGSATGTFGGSTEHRLDLDSGYYNSGIGFRLNAVYQSGSTVKGGLTPGGGTAADLRFGDIATINLRFFINFGQRPKLVEAVPFLKGSRIRLRIDNITNAVREVRDNSGATPLRYQPGYLDPVGRTIELSFRKLF